VDDGEEVAPTGNDCLGFALRRSWRIPWQGRR